MEDNNNSENFEKEAKNTANEFKESWNQSVNENRENKKLIAGILAIVLGGFGIHKFILGYNKEGIILLVVTLVLGIITCGVAASAAWIIGLIEGIIYLTKSDEEFFQTYQANKKPWF
ncbi:TM2 domain-containing protein [uncultured Planktosalinus sp.]|uniref:TM2 domain-containing protein n=1 Tax=uncultured Planktosalinus sp. TaxID=1810935 RepID=UPI0030DB0B6F